MIGLFKKIDRFIWWILTPEKLPSPPDSAQESLSGRKKFFQWLFSSDRLSGSGVRKARISRNRGLLRWLFSPERLEQEKAPAQPARQGFFRWLMATEKPEPVQKSDRKGGARKGFVRWLLSRDKLEAKDDSMRNQGPKP